MINIYLIGMPGCGKSLIGKLLSGKTGQEFYDADDALEEFYHQKINDIFSEKGEAGFREMETETLRRLSHLDNAVIATGGGAVTRPVNMELAQKSGIIVFIDRPVENILSDVVCAHRPLLADSAERLHTLYRDRIALYRKYADITVENTKEPDFVANTIIEGVKNYENHGC